MAGCVVVVTLGHATDKHAFILPNIGLSVLSLREVMVALSIFFVAVLMSC